MAALTSSKNSSSTECQSSHILHDCEGGLSGCTILVCSEPIRRCLDRLTNAKWANSDILLVSITSQSSHKFNLPLPP